MVGPYSGYLLRIDLSSGRIRREEIPRRWLDLYVGGRGLGLKYLYEEVPKGADPLGPGNKIFIMTGPLTGSLGPLTGRCCMVIKSPKTGTANDGYAGGHIGPELKYCGYDGLVIEGKSEKPVYIKIMDKEVEIRDASHLWGKGVYETSEELKKEVGRHASTAVIGPAGENLSLISCVSVDSHFVFGRGGTGAVFGSKKLKGVVISASERKMDLPEKFNSVVKRLLRESVMTDANMWAKTDGTPIIVDMSNAAGVLPTMNFREGYFEGASGINTGAIKARLSRRVACHSCPMACKKKIKTRYGELKAPEYETIGTMGSNLGISDIEELANIASIADDMGFDTISLGVTLSFATELTERGIIKSDLRWGHAEGYAKMIEDMAFRRDLGAKLADGVKKAVERIGSETEKYALHIKGSEMPAYDPRGSFGMALAYATADRGACHLRAWTIADEAFGKMNPYTFDGKAELTKELQDKNSIKWSLIICDFWLSSYEDMASLLSAALDKDVDVEYLKKCGERIWNLSRLFNVREGFSRKDDYLPSRFTMESHTKGAAAGKVIDRTEFNKALDQYYKIRGWDENGIPTKAKLIELDLLEEAEKAEREGVILP
ncbi:MAG: aldehyde ferredoxin oxidoreductase family protein [Candidatus Methanodesulfokora sp.]